MAKFLNKKEQVFDLKLTSYGNYLLSQGNFKPVYYAFYDDNVVYDIQHAAGKDGVSMGRPFRFAINTYCMKHTGTIEFRCFRSTTDTKEIEDQFRFAEKFVDAALNDGPSVEEILFEQGYRYNFPRFIWNYREYNGWVETKYDKARGDKRREYHEVA